MVIEPNPVALPVGRLFAARYEVVRPVSAGGMGAVYEVIDRRNLRRRALKVMLPNLLYEPRLRERFEREATVTAAIESEHIVEVLDAGVDDETQMPYLAMELLRGVDLGIKIQREGRLAADDVVTLLGQAALALERTHQAGVVHRDLKPDNLFLTTRDDGTPRLKILDFGIAKLVQPTGAAKTTGSVGTPLYMAPEQLKGDKDIGPACDLYALAHIAYTMLVGVEYWAEDVGEDGSVYPLLIKLLEGVKEAPSARAARRGVTLPAAFDDWFMAATAADPRARPEGAHRLVRDLAAALGVEAPVRVAARPPSSGGVVIDPSAATVDATPALEEIRRASAAASTGAPRSTAQARTPQFRSEVAPPSVVRLPLTRSPLGPLVAGGVLLAAALGAVVLWRSSASARIASPVVSAAVAMSTEPRGEPPPVVEPRVEPSAVASGSAEPPSSATVAAHPSRPELHLHPAATPPIAPQPPVVAPPQAPAAAPGPQPRRKQAGPDDPGF